MPSDPKRKLAAIMFTDMVGYTAMMQDDEPKARELIQRHRELMKPLVEKHGGTILQYVGDGTFITFDSAIESVNCGYDIQNALKVDKELSLRIGIHIGDVVSDADEVYGDGVNVASRLEPLAEPGGVCISEKIYDEIHNQPEIETVFLGEKLLKNVEHTIKIYCLTGKGLNVTNPFEEEQKSDVVSKESVTEELKTKPSSKKLLPWVAGAAVLLIFFFAKGWFSGDSSIPEVIAEENSLAVLFIENMTDPTDADRSAEMIRMLLSTDLAQSHSLRIIGSQRLYDIAKQERKGEGQLIDRSNASAVARKAGAQWMLTGTLAKVGNRMVLATEIENVKTGKVLDAQRADGNDLFSLVDALSSEIRSDMGVIASAGEIDAPVKEITTYSAVAYQHYLGGLEFLNESNFGDAIERFQSAVEIDPDFTKAYYKLAVAQWWFDPISNLNAKETVKKILLNKESLPEGELLLVEGFEAYLNGDNSTAIGIYQRLLLMYPDDKEIHYQLGEAYFHSGMGENLKALVAFERAIELDQEFTLAYRHIYDIYEQEKLYARGIRKGSELVALYPEKSRGYVSLARMYSNSGKFDLALENYRKALELNPKDYLTKELSAWTYRLMGNYTEAMKLLIELTIPEVPLERRSSANFYLAAAHAEQGQFKEAIEFEMRDRNIAHSIGVDSESNAYILLTYFHSSIGDTATAFGFIDSALALDPSIGMVIFANYWKGRLHAGRKDQIALDSAIEDIQELLKEDGVLPIWRYTYNHLLIESYHLQGDIESALLEFNKFRDSKNWIDWTLYKKAILYLEKRDFDQSLATTKAMQAPDLIKQSRHFNYPLAFYVRGMVYEELGKPKLAIDNYEALLELWKDADEEIPVRRDAIKRLANLKQGS